MKVVVTKVNTFKAKKSGDTWTAITGFDESGEKVEVLLSEADVQEFGITAKVALSKAEIAEIFAKYPVADVEFNQRGRLVGIEL